MNVGIIYKNTTDVMKNLRNSESEDDKKRYATALLTMKKLEDKYDDELLIMLKARADELPANISGEKSGPQGLYLMYLRYKEECNAKKKFETKDGPLQDKNGEFYAIKGIRTLFEKLGYLDKPNTSIKSARASEASLQNDCSR